MKRANVKKGKREIIGGIIGKKKEEKFVEFILLRVSSIETKNWKGRREKRKFSNSFARVIFDKAKREENKGRLKELKGREKKKKFVEFIYPR